jgi:hypothetical protein
MKITFNTLLELLANLHPIFKKKLNKLHKKKEIQSNQNEEINETSVIKNMIWNKKKTTNKSTKIKPIKIIKMTSKN